MTDLASSSELPRLESGYDHIKEASDRIEAGALATGQYSSEVMRLGCVQSILKYTRNDLEIEGYAGSTDQLPLVFDDAFIQNFTRIVS